MRHLPDEGLRGQRQRLQTTVKRLGDRYMWQEIEETGIPRAAAELDARIAERPAPADSNLLASDRAASTLLPFAEIVRETTSDHRQRIIRHIVERVVIDGGDVVEIAVRLEARPFFADYPAAVAKAPPDGLRALSAALTAYA